MGIIFVEFIDRLIDYPTCSSLSIYSPNVTNNEQRPWTDSKEPQPDRASVMVTYFIRSVNISMNF